MCKPGRSNNFRIILVTPKDQPGMSRHTARNKMLIKEGVLTHFLGTVSIRETKYGSDMKEQGNARIARNELTSAINSVMNTLFYPLARPVNRISPFAQATTSQPRQFLLIMYRHK